MYALTATCAGAAERCSACCAGRRQRDRPKRPLLEGSSTAGAGLSGKACRRLVPVWCAGILQREAERAGASLDAQACAGASQRYGGKRNPMPPGVQDWRALGPRTTEAIAKWEADVELRQRPAFEERFTQLWQAGRQDQAVQVRGWQGDGCSAPAAVASPRMKTRLPAGCAVCPRCCRTGCQRSYSRMCVLSLQL